MKSVKKIISMLFAVCIILSSLTVLATAAGSFIPDRSLGDQVYKVEFVSQLDEKKGTTYIDNSEIEVYKVPENTFSLKEHFINNNNLFCKVTTDKNGKADISGLVPGFYVAKEKNFKYNGKEYKSEPLTFEITEKDNYFTLYFKHSVSNNIFPIDNPITGDNAAPVFIAFGLIIAASVCIILVSHKKKNKKPANS